MSDGVQPASGSSQAHALSGVACITAGTLADGDGSFHRNGFASHHHESPASPTGTYGSHSSSFSGSVTRVPLDRSSSLSELGLKPDKPGATTAIGLWDSSLFDGDLTSLVADTAGEGFERPTSHAASSPASWAAAPRRSGSGPQRAMDSPAQLSPASGVVQPPSLPNGNFPRVGESANGGTYLRVIASLAGAPSPPIKPPAAMTGSEAVRSGAQAAAERASSSLHLTDHRQTAALFPPPSIRSAQTSSRYNRVQSESRSPGGQTPQRPETTSPSPDRRSLASQAVRRVSPHTPPLPSGTLSFNGKESGQENVVSQPVATTHAASNDHLASDSQRATDGHSAVLSTKTVRRLGRVSSGPSSQERQLTPPREAEWGQAGRTEPLRVPGVASSSPSELRAGADASMRAGQPGWPWTPRLGRAVPGGLHPAPAGSPEPAGNTQVTTLLDGSGLPLPHDGEVEVQPAGDFSAARALSWSVATPHPPAVLKSAGTAAQVGVISTPPHPSRATPTGATAATSAIVATAAHTAPNLLSGRRLRRLSRRTPLPPPPPQPEPVSPPVSPPSPPPPPPATAPEPGFPEVLGAEAAARRALREITADLRRPSMLPRLPDQPGDLVMGQIDFPQHASARPAAPEHRPPHTGQVESTPPAAAAPEVVPQFRPPPPPPLPQQQQHQQEPDEEDLGGLLGPEPMSWTVAERGVHWAGDEQSGLEVNSAAGKAAAARAQASQPTYEAKEGPEGLRSLLLVPSSPGQSPSTQSSRPAPPPTTNSAASPAPSPRGHLLSSHTAYAASTAGPVAADHRQRRGSRRIPPPASTPPPLSPAAPKPAAEAGEEAEAEAEDRAGEEAGARADATLAEAAADTLQPSMDGLATEDGDSRAELPLSPGLSTGARIAVHAAQRDPRVRAIASNIRLLAEAATEALASKVGGPQWRLALSSGYATEALSGEARERGLEAMRASVEAVRAGRVEVLQAVREGQAESSVHTRASHMALPVAALRAADSRAQEALERARARLEALQACSSLRAMMDSGAGTPPGIPAGLVQRWQEAERCLTGAHEVVGALEAVAVARQTAADAAETELVAAQVTKRRVELASLRAVCDRAAKDVRSAREMLAERAAAPAGGDGSGEEVSVVPEPLSVAAEARIRAELAASALARGAALARAEWRQQLEVAQRQADEAVRANEAAAAAACAGLVTASGLAMRRDRSSLSARHAAEREAAALGLTRLRQRLSLAEELFGVKTGVRRLWMRSSGGGKRGRSDRAGRASGGPGQAPASVAAASKAAAYERIRARLGLSTVAEQSRSPSRSAVPATDRRAQSLLRFRGLFLSSCLSLSGFSPRLFRALQSFHCKRQANDEQDAVPAGFVNADGSASRLGREGKRHDDGQEQSEEEKANGDEDDPVMAAENRFPDGRGHGSGGRGLFSRRGRGGALFAGGRGTGETSQTSVKARASTINRLAEPKRRADRSKARVEKVDSEQSIGRERMGTDEPDDAHSVNRLAADLHRGSAMAAAASAEECGEELGNGLKAAVTVGHEHDMVTCAAIAPRPWEFDAAALLDAVVEHMPRPEASAEVAAAQAASVLSRVCGLGEEGAMTARLHAEEGMAAAAESEPDLETRQVTVPKDANVCVAVDDQGEVGAQRNAGSGPSHSAIRKKELGAGTGVSVRAGTALATPQATFDAGFSRGKPHPEQNRLGPPPVGQQRGQTGGELGAVVAAPLRSSKSSTFSPARLPVPAPRTDGAAETPTEGSAKVRVPLESDEDGATLASIRSTLAAARARREHAARSIRDSSTPPRPVQRIIRDADLTWLRTPAALDGHAVDALPRDCHSADDGAIVEPRTGTHVAALVEHGGAPAQIDTGIEPEKASVGSAHSPSLMELSLVPLEVDEPDEVVEDEGGGECSSGSAAATPEHHGEPSGAMTAVDTATKLQLEDDVGPYLRSLGVTLDDVLQGDDAAAELPTSGPATLAAEIDPAVPKTDAVEVMPVTEAAEANDGGREIREQLSSTRPAPSRQRRRQTPAVRAALIFGDEEADYPANQMTAGLQQEDAGRRNSPPPRQPAPPKGPPPPTAKRVTDIEPDNSANGHDGPFDANNQASTTAPVESPTSVARAMPLKPILSNLPLAATGRPRTGRRLRFGGVQYRVVFPHDAVEDGLEDFPPSKQDRLVGLEPVEEYVFATMDEFQRECQLALVEQESMNSDGEFATEALGLTNAGGGEDSGAQSLGGLQQFWMGQQSADLWSEVLGGWVGDGSTERQPTGDFVTSPRLSEAGSTPRHRRAAPQAETQHSDADSRSLHTVASPVTPHVLDMAASASATPSPPPVAPSVVSGIAASWRHRQQRYNS